MISKRIIPCLDIKDGRIVKGRKFINLQDAGDAVEFAKFYYEQGADEIVFLDISATSDNRKTIIDITKNVAKEIFIPFTVGGGVKTLGDIERLLKAGADKVAINTAAVQNPKLIRSAIDEFGSQAIVIAIDAKMKNGNSYVYTYGGKKKTELKSIEWAKKVANLGAGEILLTSIDRDGTRKGFDLELIDKISKAVSIPVIASGGAGRKRDFVELFQKTNVSAALAAGVFHYGRINIPELKKYLKNNGVEIREC